MKYRIHDYRHGLLILENNSDYQPVWEEIKQALHNVTEDKVMEAFLKSKRDSKSISNVLNELFKKEFSKMNWASESLIFQDQHFKNKSWRLDFAKDQVSLEVAFNHSGVVAWNLLKPSIASELNHIKKAIQTSIGVVICATEELKRLGGFDSAIGSFDHYVKYTTALRSQLTIPMVIIGIEGPETFYVEHVNHPTKNNTKIGIIKDIV